MTKINYLTLDVFIYNLTKGLGKHESDIIANYEAFWSDLTGKLNQSQLEVTPVDPNRLNFKHQNYPLDGCYSRANFDDSDCFRFNCSADVEVEPSNLESKLLRLKDLAILPKLQNLDSLPEKVEYLPPGVLSNQGYLGQTWMISGWRGAATSTPLETLAAEAYKALMSKALMSKKYQYYHQEGEFLNCTVFEMWLGSQRWEGIKKDSHMMFILYPDEGTFAKAAKYYNAWRTLLYYRHKIIWAYEQGRELKLWLLNELNESLVDTKDLSGKKLSQLKVDLQNNINVLFQYVQDINRLEVQHHTVEVNLSNYEAQCQEYFKNTKFLDEFSNIVSKKYTVQLEKDHISLRPGLSILENVTATIRGMVEVEQAERDRTFQNLVGVVGVGVGTGSVAASSIANFVKEIRQPQLAERPSIQQLTADAWSSFWFAFLFSIGIGVGASLVTWLVLRLRSLYRNKP